MDPQDLAQGMTRETAIRREANGKWWNGEDPIEHPNLVRSFEGWIMRAEDGRYCLSNDINWAYFALEGPPYFVRAVRVLNEDAMLTLSGDIEEALDPTTLRQGEDGSLWCDVRDGLAARFDNHAVNQLAPLLGEDEAGPFVRIRGVKHRPKVVADPMG
jgi:uncharacterized protein